MVLLFDVFVEAAERKQRGPVVGGTDVLPDAAGSPIPFALDGFSNTYQVLR